MADQDYGMHDEPGPGAAHTNRDYGTTQGDPYPDPSFGGPGVTADMTPDVDPVPDRLIAGEVGRAGAPYPTTFEDDDDGDVDVDASEGGE